VSQPRFHGFIWEESSQEHAMAKDVLETEHRSPREYEPDPTPLEVSSVPRLREITVDSLSAPQYAPLLFAAPESVVADGKLKPTVQTAPYRVHMFQHGLKSFVPARIAAVVPGGLTEFTRALIFFHPLPTQKAGYDDAQYAAQTGNWSNIYRYCDQQGVQLAASKRKLVLIFPIFNLASTETCGRFPAEWKSLVEDIMVMLRKSHAPGLAKDPKPTLTDVVTASYSAGVKYMHTFLTKATDLGGSLREVYDYDGRFSTHTDLSERLGIYRGVKVITYDQHLVKESEVVKENRAGKGIHLPEWRWRDLPNGFTSFLNYPVDPLAVPIKGSAIVHGAIPRYIMFHSLSESSVGR
jgi:hypothetical protein